MIVGSGLSEIGEGAFKESALTKLSLAQLGSLTIGKDAFRGCADLTDVFISSDVITMTSSGAFTDIDSKATLTFDCKHFNVLAGNVSQRIVYIPYYDAQQASVASTFKSNGNAVVCYTPTECLIVDNDGFFMGAASCDLHSGNTHGTIYLPKYYSFDREIVGIKATDGVLPDGDGSALAHVYHYYKTGTVAQYEAPSETVAGVTEEKQMALNNIYGQTA